MGGGGTGKAGTRGHPSYSRKLPRPRIGRKIRDKSDMGPLSLIVADMIDRVKRTPLIPSLELWHAVGGPTQSCRFQTIAERGIVETRESLTISVSGRVVEFHPRSRVGIAAPGKHSSCGNNRDSDCI